MGRKGTWQAGGSVWNPTSARSVSSAWSKAVVLGGVRIEAVSDSRSESGEAMFCISVEVSCSFTRGDAWLGSLCRALESM